jgi:hypothetical protein
MKAPTGLRTGALHGLQLKSGKVVDHLPPRLKIRAFNVIRLGWPQAGTVAL